MARGRTYEQIETKVREGNGPSRDYISRILNELDPVEVSDEEAVCISA